MRSADGRSEGRPVVREANNAATFWFFFYFFFNLQRFYNLRCLKKIVCDETQLVFQLKIRLVVTLNLLEF